MKLICPIVASIPLAACQSTAGETPAKAPASRSASLGVETEVPAQELAREMGLGFEVRQQGRLVRSVIEGSAAHEAGIRDGDVLLRLDEVTLYSQDDIDDVVSVHHPGDRVTATVVRSESHDREELVVELGRAARTDTGIQWQYASLAQLPAALEKARAEKKKVLVGLSGAET